MAQLFINNFLVNLAEAISTTDTSFDLTDAGDIPTLGGDFVVLRLYRRVRDEEFKFEYIKVTAVSGNTITCTRGYSGSTALEYEKGSFVSSFIDKTFLESFPSSYLGISAKAADSDKVDGYHAGSFIRSDASDTATGLITFGNASSAVRAMVYIKDIEGYGSGSLEFYGSDGYRDSGIFSSASHLQLVFYQSDGSSVYSSIEMLTDKIQCTSPLWSRHLTDHSYIVISADADTKAAVLSFKRGTAARWSTVKDDISETGSNAGSNYAIYRYADNGSYLGAVLKFIRSGGSCYINSVYPFVTNNSYLGNGSYAWAGITSYTAVNVISDEKTKENVLDLTDKEYDLIMALRPISYRQKDTIIPEVKDPETGKTVEKKRVEKHSRQHHGLLAQELETAIKSVGLTTNEVGAFIYDKKTDNYGIRYGELIPLLIGVVQKQDKRIKQLEDNYGQRNIS